jgi:hypothetical protein
MIVDEILGFKSASSKMGYIEKFKVLKTFKENMERDH